MQCRHFQPRGVKNTKCSSANAKDMNHRRFSADRCCFLVCLLAVLGCGTNQFQQELRTEEAAVKLTNETVAGGYHLMSTSDLKGLLDSEERFLLVDAMPAAASFDKGHIAGAVNFSFPKEAMDSWSDEVMEGRQKSEFETLLGEDKDRRIVMYCGFVKCARSHNAAVVARQLGYTNVYRYAGGIYAWRGAGHDLTTN